MFMCAAGDDLIMEKQNSSGESAVETGTEADDGRDTWLPSRRGMLKLTGGGLGAMATGGTLLGSASAATAGDNCVQADFVTGTSPINDLSTTQYVDNSRLIEAQWGEAVNHDEEGEETTRSANTDCGSVSTNTGGVAINTNNYTAEVTFSLSNCGGNTEDLLLVSYESPCNGAASNGGQWDPSNADQQSVFDTESVSGLGDTTDRTLTVDVPPLTANAPQRSNAEAYFSLDQSSLPATNELNGTDTTTVGDPTPGASGAGEQTGTAFDFDGTGDALNYPSQGIDYSGSSDWTTSLWINPDSIPGGGSVTLWRPRAYNMWFALYADSEPEDGITLGEYDGSTKTNTLSAGTPATDAWTHVTVVYDTNASDQYKIYFDGTQEASGNIGDPAGKGNKNMIGGMTNGGTDYFDGQIDEVYIYSAALSSTEVSELYNTAT